MAGPMIFTSCRSCRGFTLIELMLVIAISALMMSIAAPRLGDFLRHRQLDEGARQLRYFLEHARQLSLSETAKAEVRVSSDWRAWTLWVVLPREDEGKSSANPAVAAGGTLSRYAIAPALTLKSVRRDGVDVAFGQDFVMEIEPALMPHTWEMTLTGTEGERRILMAAGGGGVRIESP